MSGKVPTERLAPDEAGLARAASVLLDGGLVAVPTETVYGLAARADREAAVAAIYRAKGRPDFNPLIVHVGDGPMAHTVAHFDKVAEQLADAFWPGPLTLVLPQQAGAPLVPAVTAGLATVAVRMPDHPVMTGLLKRLGVPLAAPSANRSGAVSPTMAEHVLASLAGRIDAVLDAGPTRQGLESTIVAVRPSGGWSVLRPGPITIDDIIQVVGTRNIPSSGAIEAPGQLASHYSPGKPMRLDAEFAAADEFMIGFGPVAADCSLSGGGDLASAAARLYACLHAAAASPKPRVAVSPIPERGIGAAINDRLRRAAA